MSEYNKLKQIIEKIAKGVVDRSAPSRKVHARLVSVSPLKFRVDDKIDIYGQFLISPKYHVFTDEDIGTEYVFLQDYSGQQFIFLYEAAPQGENGIPYTFTGELIDGELKGKTASGEAVTITEGTFNKMKHSKGVD